MAAASVEDPPVVMLLRAREIKLHASRQEGHLMSGTTTERPPSKDLTELVDMAEWEAE